MEATILLIISLLSLMVFDVLAIRFGADSRDLIGDDHQRPIGP